jgi:hypothetical protein
MAQVVLSDKYLITMCDISCDDLYLYCGKFSQYFYNSEYKLEGISISNVIRYKVTEKENAPPEVISYLLPHQGEMYFKSDKIKNVHFWKVKQNHTFELKLSKAHHIAKIAWALSLQKYLPLLRLQIKVFGKAFDKDLVESLVK